MVPKSGGGATRFVRWIDSEIAAMFDKYHICVHLFGATSSLFCANFALEKAVEDFGNSSQRKINEGNFLLTNV